MNKISNTLRILRWFCPPHLHEEIEGDLIQKFEKDLNAFGERRAKRRLIWNTIRFFRPGIVLRNSLSVKLISGNMLINNLRFSVRHLGRQKLNTALHVVGLTLGMSVCLLIGLFIYYELSFDSYPKADRTYRVNTTFKEAGMEFNLYATPVALADAIRSELTGVENVFFSRAQFKTVVEIDPKKLFKQEHALVVEPGYLNAFNIKVLEGNGRVALATPYQALLTQATATKFYGEDDAIGKTFKYKNKYIITVAGIIENPPVNTHLPASMLLSYINDEEFMDNGDTWFFGDFTWAKLATSTYVVLKENQNPKDFEDQLKKLTNKYINSAETLDKEISCSLGIQSVRDIHFDTKKFGGGPWVKAIDTNWLWFFGCLGVIIIALACINFLNLSTAQGYARSKEVGIRKSIGAIKSQLIILFLGEAGILVVLSGILSVVVAYLSLESLNDLLDKEITFQPLMSLSSIAVLLLAIIFIVILSGLYPAWVISKFNPVVTIKSTSSSTGTSWLRKGLVVVQFVVSCGLLIAVFVMAQQVKLLHTKELGVERENIISLEIINANKVNEFINDLKQISGVKDVSLSRSSPISNDHWWNSISQTETDERQSVCAIYGDENFISFFGLRLLSGRVAKSFEFVPDSARESNYVSKVVVNEHLLKMLSLGSPDEAIGKHFWWGNDTEIIGVVSNFNFEPLKYDISSALITQDPSIYAQANIKIEKHSKNSETMAAIELAWKRVYPEGVYEVSVLDTQVDAYYKAEEKLYFLFKIFVALAISISCLGLWGLITFTTQQRTKEIGIRKVLGASVNSVIYLLCKDFLSLVLVASCLASPLAYYFMNDWLAGFAYHITIGWQVFIISAIALLAITIITVGSQTMRAALANPVKSLRSE